MGWTHCPPKGLPAPRWDREGWRELPERRPLRPRFKSRLLGLELIKTRLELSRVSDLYELKPPRMQPSQFPINNWVPVGFPGRAGHLTSFLHYELDPGRRGGKETHSQASRWAPTTQPAGRRGCSRRPRASFFASFMQSTTLPRVPKNWMGGSDPGLPQVSSQPLGSLRSTTSSFLVPPAYRKNTQEFPSWLSG